MTATILDTLPTWSKTIEPGRTLAYGELAPIAGAFLALPTETRRNLIRQYHEQYCFPRLDLERASAIYLFFRVIFKLPRQLPRVQAKVFGGWLHPSIGTGQPYFDLSWPVNIDEDSETMTIDRFTGYSGKAYDVLGEYDYLVNLFAFRESAKVRKLVIRQ
jgi:hypothetical protein